MNTEQTNTAQPPAHQEKNQLTPAGQLSRYLNQYKSSLVRALPSHLNAERMIRLTLTCFSQNSSLRNCTPESIFSSLIIASQLGLEPGVCGQGYLIPYKGECTFIPGWQGLAGLLNNTGRATAWTGAVYEGDEFDFELGSNPHLRHVPGCNFGDAEKLIWVYACAKVNGSEMPVIEAWPMSRVKSHRDANNKVGKSHYSFGNMEMYARKVVFLQVIKYMPRSIELNNAVDVANAAEMGRMVKIDDGVVIDVDAEQSAPLEQQGVIDPSKLPFSDPSQEPQPEPFENLL